MLRSRKLFSMPIINLEEGLQVGTVKNLIIDPVKMEVAALVMNQRALFSEQRIIPYAQVRSTGNDAITIDKSASVQRIVKLPDLVKLVKLKTDPIGTKVVTEIGTILGFVDEFYIDETNGKMVSLEITGKFIENLFKGRALLSCDYIRTIGPSIIIAKEGAEVKLEKIDSTFQETINSLKQNTSNFWANTKERTMQLSKNLKDKYDKKEAEPEPDSVGEITIIKEEIIPEAVPSTMSETTDLINDVKKELTL